MSQATQESEIADRHDRYSPLDTSHSTTATPIHDRPRPLKLIITPYRLLNVVVLLGLGISKAVYYAKGQSVTAANLDWAVGLFTVLMYVHSSYIKLLPTLIPFLSTLKLVLHWLV